MLAELQVDKSHRMVTTPRENIPACRGGGGALQMIMPLVSWKNLIKYNVCKNLIIIIYNIKTLHYSIEENAVCGLRLLVTKNFPLNGKTYANDAMTL